MDIPEGQETDVPVRGRRPGKPHGFLQDARRAAIRDSMRELHGHAGRFRELARSGEVGRGRKMRNLARASYLLELERTEPGALDELPDDRREDMRAFLDEHRDELARRGPEVRKFLEEHPDMKTRLKGQADRRMRHRDIRNRERRQSPPAKPNAKPRRR